jgi:hypothetical protein
MRRATSPLIMLGTVVILVSSLSASDAPATAPAAADTPARRAFERMKCLEGTWQGKSTKGWEERTTFKVIAGGSAVMYTSFDAHPGQTMLTVFHLDGEHLMLTHYCVARNQPRLRATEISQDGNTITFTFLDATNLTSRDKGHMDKALFRFDGDDRFTTKWTWYQDGQERWMEEIMMTRVTDGDR